MLKKTQETQSKVYTLRKRKYINYNEKMVNQTKSVKEKRKETALSPLLTVVRKMQHSCFFVQYLVIFIAYGMHFCSQRIKRFVQFFFCQTST